MTSLFRVSINCASRFVLSVLVITSVFISSACAKDYTETEMQPLAATSADIALAVRSYARQHPEEIKAGVDEVTLVIRATAHDSSIMNPYKKFIVKGRPTGVVLICDSKGERGLIEDAACNDILDDPRWRRPGGLCEFILDLELVCNTGQ